MGVFVTIMVSHMVPPCSVCLELFATKQHHLGKEFFVIVWYEMQKYSHQGPALVTSQTPFHHIITFKRTLLL